MLSNGKETKKTVITLPPEEELRVGQEIMYGDTNIRITKLERDSSSLQNSKAGDVDNIWAKKYDKVKVKVAVSHGPKTYSRKIIAAPEEEFTAGDIISFDEYRVAVKKIRDRYGIVKKSVVKARDISRIYTSFIK